MKKQIFLPLIAMLLTISICGCKETKTKENISPVKAYAQELSDIYQKSKNEDATFLLKDLDNNGVKELIILNQLEISVYTYQDKVLKMGDYDFKTATTKFLYSDNKAYGGIFYNYTSGGLEHYGYISLDNSTLKVEELWNKDFSEISSEMGTDRKVIEEISKDKKLIKASKEACEKNNDLIFHEINTADISKLEKKIEEEKQ